MKSVDEDINSSSLYRLSNSMCSAQEFLLISDFTILRHYDYEFMGFLKVKYFKAQIYSCRLSITLISFELALKLRVFELKGFH